MRRWALPALLFLALGVPAGASQAPEAESPAVGDVFPAFDADAVHGGTQRIDYPQGSTTILLFFLSGCPVCHRMIPEWNRAYEMRAKGLRIVGVLMDQEPPGFFEVTPISFPVVRSPGVGFLRSHSVNRAPLTLRIGAGGVVRDVGLGLLDPIRLGMIFRPE